MTRQRVATLIRPVHEFIAGHWHQEVDRGEGRDVSVNLAPISPRCAGSPWPGPPMPIRGNKNGLVGGVMFARLSVTLNPVSFVIPKLMGSRNRSIMVTQHSEPSTTHRRSSRGVKSINSRKVHVPSATRHSLMSSPSLTKPCDRALSQCFMFAASIRSVIERAMS